MIYLLLGWALSRIGHLALTVVDTVCRGWLTVSQRYSAVIAFGI